MKFEEKDFNKEFPSLTIQHWSNHLSFKRDEKNRIGLPDGDFVLSAKDIQKHCIDKQRVRDAIISLGEEREFEINLLLKELGFTKDDFISLKRWS